ncbi:MAG TPA: GNAT family N-acetyltransferase, partial [Arenibacter sp.]|nr:GNAT family N-acetyltransferase [Arenibacter sp.]
AETISIMLSESAKARGSGVAVRTPEYLTKKIEEGKAVIALDGEKIVGFCYMETWEHGKYVANSGLIVHEDYRQRGLGKKIKETIFNLTRSKYPNSKIFGITTNPATVKLNTALGYKQVSFTELTTDLEFWKGCMSCANYEILVKTGNKNCLCIGMLYEPPKD